MLNLLVITAELMTPHPTADAKATLHMIISGRFAKTFWLGAMFCGNPILKLLRLLLVSTK